MGYIELTDAEAKALSGNGLTVPDDVAPVEEVWSKGKANERKVLTYTWDEVGKIQGIETFEANPDDEKDPYADLEHEKAWVKLIVDAKYSAFNGNVRFTDFMDFYLGLRTTNKAKLLEWKQTAPEGDPKRMWHMRWMDTQKSGARMAQLVTAMGEADRLRSKKFFGGLGPLLPVIPRFQGQPVTIRFKQTVDGDKTRDVVLAYKRA